MPSKKVERAIEKARKEKVDEYKKAIANMEEDDKLFYENQLKREQISQEEFAKGCKDRSERYARYASEVLEVTYMTEQEKYELSREYMQKSEAALTEHIKIIKDLERQKLDASLQNSEAYVSDRDYYSNWEKFGDDPISAFKRVDKNLSQSVLSGTLSYEEYYKKLSEFGTEMYNDRIANSNRWLSHESEMNRITTQEYIAGLERMKAYTQQYYSAGIISHRQYTDSMQSLEERIFDKKKEQHQEILRQAEEEKDAIDRAAKAKIESLEEEYNAKISAMDKAERKEELSELKAQEKIYANAQTKEGKERLSEIRERIDDINDETRRAKLKEDLANSKDYVLSSAQKKKNAVDKSAAKQAMELGLYYDSQEGYKMLSSARNTFDSVLTEQTNFSVKSKNEIKAYNTDINQLMTESTQVLADNILTSFAAFASGVRAMKNQIFSDVDAVNSLDFSRFGSSSSPIRTSVTYNDYGDKNISGIQEATDYFSNLGNLLAKGGKL